MDANAFDVSNDLNKLYTDSGPLKVLQNILDHNNLDLYMAYAPDGSIKLKSTHPIRIYAKDIYGVLLRLNLVSYINLSVEYTYNDVKKSVSKKFSQQEDIDEIVDDLVSLPHDRIIDIIIDTDVFKIVEVPESIEDSVSVILKKGDPKLLFKSLLLYLFPFVSVPVEKSVKYTINFEKAGDGFDISTTLHVDDASIGIKSKKVRFI
ncbi:MAG: hypothetical protein OH316_00405 [Candidatus Parvarchaeota archaeon]|nr:hypothetical protein [Candidatus Parvarchaeota archaeon]